MPGIRITDHLTTCLFSVRLGFTSDFDQEIGQDLHQIDTYSSPYQRPVCQECNPRNCLCKKTCSQINKCKCPQYMLVFFSSNLMLLTNTL